jgi:radical SAM superfamily enzyme YgiQ (UPF0313 family)
MNVLLVNPPSPYLENAAAYPPMGLMYVAAALEKEGCDVTIQDMAAGDTFSPGSSVDLIGFTCVTPNVNQVKRLLDVIGYQTPTMIGGAHPTFVPTESFGADSLIMGEFENITHDIINDLRVGKMGRIYHGDFASPAKIGIPARHLVDMRNYSPGGAFNATPVYTSRGCVFDCAFCCKSGGGSYRRIPLHTVFADLLVCDEHHIKTIVIGDDNFFIHKGHAENILEYIKEHFNFNLRINTDARNLDPNLLSLARKAGASEVSMGIETGSPELLTAMKKHTTVTKNKLAIQLLKDYGFKVKIYLISNFPGETEETIQQTIDFVNQNEPDAVLVSNFAPMPGCDVYMHPERYGVTRMSQNWDDYYLVGIGGGFSPCFETSYLTAAKQVELHQMLLDGIK